MTTLNDVTRWKNVAADPSTINQPPVQIQGVHPLDEQIIIRLLISRENAVEHFGTGLFGKLDVLLLSASCWDTTTGDQIAVDEQLFKAHLVELLGDVHEFAAFSRDIGSPNVSHRAMLINEYQKPRIPTERQMAHLWGNLSQAE